MLGPVANHASMSRLGAADEIAVALAQPGQEPHRDVGLRTDDRVPALGEFTGLSEASQPWAVMPAQVGGDEPAVGRIFDGREETFGPALIGGEVAVALR